MSEAGTRRVALDDLHRIELTGASATVVGGEDAGARVDIDAAGCVIGSGPNCDLRLQDPLISRRHLELRATEDGVRVLDLESTNGTLFAGASVRAMTLTGDALLTLGDTSLQIELSAEPLGINLSPNHDFGGALAHSPAMRHVVALLERAAGGDVTVLLEGDSGTGKDVLATALHDNSKRRDGPFVVVDCGALPEGLLESELFGHEKGAFTGAQVRRRGAFERADGGTLFLDEIGELPLTSQPKLLRALESRSFRRVGGEQTQPVDVRVIAATNRRLREAVRQGEFREDLFYRLAVVHVRLPPLRDRPEDVLPLAKLFLRRASGEAEPQIPEALARLLQSYPWPGNARELRNVIDRFATFGGSDARLLFGAGLADQSAGAAGAFDRWLDMPYHDAKAALLQAFHQVALPRAVERAGGQVVAAAEQLGLPRQSLYRMLQQLRDEPDDAT